VPFFAPELEISILPGWDCLPYDRASPSVAVTSQRMSTLQALQQPAKKKQLVVTTIGAVIQKYVTPFRIRQTGERLAAGREISRERLASLLQSNGYFRVDTVASSRSVEALSTCFPPAAKSAFAWISSVTKSKASAVSIRLISAASTKSSILISCLRLKPLWTKTRLSGSVLATANALA
jgi:hypothetical protein